MSQEPTREIGGIRIDIPVPPGREFRWFPLGAEVELDPERLDLFASMFPPSDMEMLRAMCASSGTGSVVGHMELAGQPALCRVAFINGPQIAVPHDFLKKAHA